MWFLAERFGVCMGVWICVWVWFVSECVAEVVCACVLLTRASENNNGVTV
jgi:hypothetical protein